MNRNDETSFSASEELTHLRQEVARLRALSARHLDTEARLARLANFPNRNPDILVETDFRGQVTYLNSMAQARFPEIREAGFGHPLLLGLAEMVPAMVADNMPYSADEICLGEATFERQICYAKDADSERVRIYVHDISRRKQAEKAIQTLARQAVYGQEEERRRLSRELHDEAGQSLTALKLSLELLRAEAPAEADPLRANLAQAITLADATMDRLRNLAHGLRPPALDTLGLDLTLQACCRDFARRGPLDIQYSGTRMPGLSDAMNICLYRVLQEALVNVVKHAQASQVHVGLDFKGESVRLTVEDDGLGMDLSAGEQRLDGIGFLGMRERLELLGGSLALDSRPGQGLRLEALLPLRVVA